MESLQSFLHPKRKENKKFILSDAFLDEKGNPIQWEMRQLSASEGMELQPQFEGKNYTEIMVVYLVNSLVYPNFKDRELLDALSKREGRPVLSAAEALKLTTTDAELAKLIAVYTDYNSLTTNFEAEVNKVKN